MGHREASTSSGLLTSDTAVVAQSCILDCIVVSGDGTNAASVIAYDNATAASGLEVGYMILPANATAPTGTRTVVWTPPVGVYCNKGIYVDVAGTNAKFIIYYRLA